MVRMLQVSTLALALSAVACKKSAPEPAMLSAAPTSPMQASVPAHVADVQRLMENFRRVSFDLDSSTLNAQTKRVLDENAGILQRRTDVKIEVQGHCDERGTTDYNLALGQRRAAAVQSYLVSSGVSPSRITLVSYGEERPLAAGGGEVAWSQNRRAEFRVTVGGDGLVDGTTR